MHPVGKIVLPLVVMLFVYLPSDVLLVVEVLRSTVFDARVAIGDSSTSSLQTQSQAMLSFKISIPGSFLPSKNSRDAPPPVET